MGRLTLTLSLTRPQRHYGALLPHDGFFPGRWMPPVGKKRWWRPAAEHALKGAIAIDSRGGGCHTDSPSLCAHVGGGREGGRLAWKFLPYAVQVCFAADLLPFDVSFPPPSSLLPPNIFSLPRASGTAVIVGMPKCARAPRGRE